MATSKQLIRGEGGGGFTDGGAEAADEREAERPVEHVQLHSTPLARARVWVGSMRCRWGNGEREENRARGRRAECVMTPSETETKEELIPRKWISRPTTFYTVLFPFLRYNKIQVGNFLPCFSSFSFSCLHA
jgi:hypothetical protein